MWEDPNEAEDVEPLNSEENSSPVEVASPFPEEEVDPPSFRGNCNGLFCDSCHVRWCWFSSGLTPTSILLSRPILDSGPRMPLKVSYKV
jgi:hypothetical protein